MKLLSAVENFLVRIETALIIVFLGVMVVLAFLQVILRNLFSFGFLWADPLLRYLVVWVGFLGAVVATKEEKHLGIDFLNRLLSPRALHIVKIVVDGFAAAVAFILTQAAFQFLFEGITGAETDLFGIPKRIYFAILPAGFALIAFHFAIRVIRHIHDALKGAKPNQAPAPIP